MAKKLPLPVVDDVDAWNDEDASDINTDPNLKRKNITVASRDWTVGTIVQQVENGNIDLDPAFQRRNAWRDVRRSRLIESFILGFPVPQIVLAENPHKRGQFIVIDGKQRLLTIAGFYEHEYRDYWTRHRFSGLEVLRDLNKVAIDDFLNKPQYSNERRQLANADIRTTVISGFQGEDILFDIFYRINTGSVPLSSQELRHALHRGEFAKYLLQVTGVPNALWDSLRITSPDPRLRDVELILRLISWRRSSNEYKGNMKAFLDATMSYFNSRWNIEHATVEALVAQILHGIEASRKIFGDSAGRKLKNSLFETSLNRALFEVQVFYFSFPEIRAAALRKGSTIKSAFQKLSEDPAFVSSIESTTKSIENSRIRFEKFRVLLETVLNQKIQSPKIGRGG